MKNFLIINPMRTASRAFNIILKSQDLNIPARLKLDAFFRIIAQTDSLKDRIEIYRILKNNSDNIGLVNHFTRIFFFRYGLSDLELKRIHSELCEHLSIETLFVPIRNPTEALLSEFNRAAAIFLGDWNFIDHSNFWKEGFDISQPLNKRRFDVPSGKVNFNFQEVCGAMSYWNGTISKMLRTFDTIFDFSYLIEYNDLVKKPDYVFGKIADIADFKIIRDDLFNTKLNGLGNRLLWRNPINLKFKKESIRVYVELDKVAPLWGDYGNMIIINNSLTGFLPEVERELGGSLCLCMNADHWMAISKEFRQALQSLHAYNGLKDILGSFDISFRHHFDFYKLNSFGNLPTEVFENYQHHLKSDTEIVLTLLERGSLRRV